MTPVSFDLQLLNLCAALLLLLSFAMLAQRRIVTLVNLLALQGALLLAATLLLAWRTQQHHLYISAALTLALKVILLPWLLHRLIRRLQVYRDTEPLLNIPGTLLVGVLVVVFSFGLAQPISALASTATRSAIGIAVAVVLLSFVTMINRRKAMSQVVGFLSMENGLFFGAMSATYGMPMIVELGVALDVLVAVLVLGVFFFQIREQFDSLDLHHLEALKEPSSTRPAAEER
ncbi:MAG: formate hydrogenlyase [Steroidobacteraceae bacterium]|jgi:hydrogenase-4 component E|nr:formate hydrogenlyase [Steroidobacteraceae bacterium]